MPLNEESKPLHGFMTRQVVVKPTQTTEGAVNRASNFQQKLWPCFAELFGNRKAFIDDYIFYTQTECEALVL